ncbi:hypothetical protein [Jiangella alba]|uniref:Uncharacterized protein n=1 Tax=Jiangella alba TaxID=561176 RepID=A0A1H5PEZ3_9ACTN|nr:hypothetical protein [Jiangella alba]SEF12435.1 hypothetical protein SAMN04488561_4239 [Jiangella alba]
MIPRTKAFARYIGTWFDTTDSADLYIEACERAPKRLAEDADGSFHAIRDEFAAHIRDSSNPPMRGSSQWATDEWYRSVWYDLFGPEAPPGDPYPVPADQWGRERLTDYMLHAVDEDEEGSSEGAAAWLAARGLTAQGVYDAISGETVRRPEPEGYADHLRRLTEAGLREA